MLSAWEATLPIELINSERQGFVRKTNCVIKIDVSGSLLASGVWIPVSTSLIEFSTIPSPNQQKWEGLLRECH